MPLRLSILFIALIASPLSFADEILPNHCQAFVIDGDSIHIPKEKPRVMLFHNLAKTDIWLVSESTSSKLTPNNWSALALDKSALQLNCIESKPGHEQVVSCQEVISSCIWPISARPKDKKGLIWAGEDMQLENLSAYIARQGFVLPEKKT